jgi:hypothetical protein
MNALFRSSALEVKRTERSSLIRDQEVGKLSSRISRLFRVSVTPVWLRRQPLAAFILLTFLAFSLLGCATSSVETRKKERPAYYAALTPEQKQLVDQGKIQVGMTPDAVYLAWGSPAEILESETPEGHTTNWIYHGQWVQEYRYWIGPHLESDYYPRDYVRAEIVFQKGTVVSWRTLPKPVP